MEARYNPSFEEWRTIAERASKEMDTEELAVFLAALIFAQRAR
jgi:hypothetical protein